MSNTRANGRTDGRSKTWTILLVVGLAASACRDPDLANTNIANRPGGAPVVPNNLNSEQVLVVSNDELAGIRTAMTALLGGPDDTPVAKLAVNAPCPGDTANGCLSPQHLNSYPATLQGLIATNLFPKDNTLATFQIPAPVPSTLEMLNPNPGGSYDIDFTHDPSNIRLLTNRSDHTVDVGFPFVAKFPDGQIVDLSCACDGANVIGALPSVAAGPLCEPLCSQIAASMPWHGMASVQLRVRIRRARFLVALGPSLPEVWPFANPNWTKGLYPSAKDFHLDRMFNVHVRSVPATSSLAWDSGLPGGSANTGVDVGVGAEAGCYLDGLDVDWCGTDNEKEIAQKVASGLACAVDQAFADAFAQQVYTLVVSYNPSQFPPPLPAGVSTLPCSLTTAACRALVASDLLPASANYQIWDWFAGPFGPLDPSPGAQKKYFPIKSIEYTEECPPCEKYPGTDVCITPPPPCSYTYPAPSIQFHYDLDPDHDFVLTPEDNCPDVPNDQTDSDGDGVGDACDGCPCSAGEVDPTAKQKGFGAPDGDGTCDACIAINTKCIAWCLTHPVDNCPGIPNPGQENCNPDAEIANNLASKGDACDVPCSPAVPFTEPLGASFGSPACQPGSVPQGFGLPACPVLVDSGLEWYGLVGAGSAPFLGAPVAAGETMFTHCICSGKHDTPEDRIANCTHKANGDALCVLGKASAFPQFSLNQNPSASQFKPISTTVPTNGQVVGVPGYQTPTQTNAIYSSTYGTKTADVRQRSWRFDKDLAAFGVTFTPPPAGVASVTDLASLSAQLAGVGWAQTARFASQDLRQQPYDGVAGLTVADLANHYFAQDLTPRFNYATLPPLVSATLAHLGLICPSCASGLLSPWLVSPASGTVLEVTPTVASDVTAKLDPSMVQLLATVGGTTELVMPSETVASLRVQGVATRAVVLDEQTLLPVQTVIETPTGLSAVTAVPCPEGEPRCDVFRTRSVRALSGTRGELYVVGRDHRDGIEHVAVLGLDGTAFLDRPLGGVEVGGVELAVTFRSSDDSLYVLDRIDRAGKTFLRLLRVGRTGIAAELAAVPYQGVLDQFYLGTTPDGLIALSAARAKNGPTVFLLLEPSDSGVKLAGWLTRPGRLVAQPDAREWAGLSLVEEPKPKAAVAVGVALRNDFHSLPPDHEDATFPWLH